MNDLFISKAAEALAVDQETIREAVESGDPEIFALLTTVVDLDETQTEWQQAMARHRAALIA